MVLWCAHTARQHVYKDFSVDPQKTHGFGLKSFYIYRSMVNSIWVWQFCSNDVGMFKTKKLHVQNTSTWLVFGEGGGEEEECVNS